MRRIEPYHAQGIAHSVTRTIVSIDSSQRYWVLSGRPVVMTWTTLSTNEDLYLQYMRNGALYAIPTKGGHKSEELLLRYLTKCL